MKNVKIEVPNGYEIDKEKSTFENIVFREVEKVKYPMSVKEIGGRNWIIDTCGDVGEIGTYDDVNQVSSKERAEAFLALMQLVELRDKCNEIDGVIIDWSDSSLHKYSIVNYKGDLYKETRITTKNVLFFGKKSTRDWFLETHIDLIEQAKELI